LIGFNTAFPESKDECLKIIKDNYRKTIIFSGHGNKNGDWYFEDDFVTFQDILDLSLDSATEIMPICCNALKWKDEEEKSYHVWRLLYPLSSYSIKSLSGLFTDAFVTILHKCNLALEVEKNLNKICEIFPKEIEKDIRTWLMFVIKDDYGATMNENWLKNICQSCRGWSQLSKEKKIELPEGKPHSNLSRCLHPPCWKR
jgi:hypothetical protein